MNLHPDWKYILTKAWSVRWLAIAAVLDGTDLFLRLLLDTGHQGPWLIIGAAACTAAAGVARVTAQKNYKAEAETT